MSPKFTLTSPPAATLTASTPNLDSSFKLLLKCVPCPASNAMWSPAAKCNPSWINVAACVSLMLTDAFTALPPTSIVSTCTPPARKLLKSPSSVIVLPLASTVVTPVLSNAFKSAW